MTIKRTNSRLFNLDLQTFFKFNFDNRYPAVVTHENEKYAYIYFARDELDVDFTICINKEGKAYAHAFAGNNAYKIT